MTFLKNAIFNVFHKLKAGRSKTPQKMEKENILKGNFAPRKVNTYLSIYLSIYACMHAVATRIISQVTWLFRPCPKSMKVAAGSRVYTSRFFRIKFAK